MAVQFEESTPRQCEEIGVGAPDGRCRTPRQMAVRAAVTFSTYGLRSVRLRHDLAHSASDRLDDSVEDPGRYAGSQGSLAHEAVMQSSYLVAEHHAVMIKTPGSGGQHHPRGTESSRAEDGHDDDVIAERIPNVGRDHQGWPWLMRVVGAARSVYEPDFATPRLS